MAGGTKAPGPVGEFIATTFRELREIHGPTYRRLAAQTGLGHNHIHNLLTGRNSMRVEEVVTLCAAYGIEPGNLIRQAIAYATTGSPTTYDPAKTYPPTRFPSTITLDGYSLAAKEWKDRTAEIEGHQEMP